MEDQEDFFTLTRALIQSLLNLRKGLEGFGDVPPNPQPFLKVVGPAGEVDL